MIEKKLKDRHKIELPRFYSPFCFPSRRGFDRVVPRGRRIEPNPRVNLCIRAINMAINSG